MIDSRPDLRTLQGATIGGRYDLGAMVGQGTFGAVFASRQHLLGIPVRRVAVKVSKRTGIELTTARELFADAFALAEAMDRLLDADARRHLVHVYDVGIAAEHDRRAYVVMEYVEGHTLAAEMRAYRRVPAALMVGWVRQACRALAGLHALDPPVLHRDVKPDNILIGRDSVRLVDFGLAARMHVAGLVPGVAGTTDYMAPETARGASIAASDVYSLGVVLYEGLSGARPFVPPPGHPRALHQEWIAEHQPKLLLAPPTRRSDPKSAALDRLVLACLRFEPGERPHDAGALLQALDGLGRPAGDEPRRSPLQRGRMLRLAGDLEGARSTLQDAITATHEPQERFALLRELGAALSGQGDDDAAAKWLVEAWRLTCDTAILRTRAERAALLRSIAGCYERSGNAYQAARHAQLADDEDATVRHA